MADTPIQSFLPVIFLLILGLGFAGAFLLLSYSLGPKKPLASKLDVYECGVPLTGAAHERFSVKFFLIAMIFLIFDVEVVFLFPWAVLLKDFKAAGLGLAVLSPMLIFLIVLGVGLMYEYKHGALDWEN